LRPPAPGFNRLGASGLSGALFSEDFEVALALEGRELDISDHPYGDIVESQLAADMDLAGFRVEVRLGQVAAGFVQWDAELGATARLGEFNQNVAAVEHFPKEFHSALGTETDFYGMGAF
jgi:hypothetical protein